MWRIHTIDVAERVLKALLDSQDKVERALSVSYCSLIKIFVGVCLENAVRTGTRIAVHRDLTEITKLILILEDFSSKVKNKYDVANERTFMRFFNISFYEQTIVLDRATFLKSKIKWYRYVCGIIIMTSYYGIILNFQIL